MSGKESKNNESKFGKKKSGNRFSREKTYATEEADILLADKKQNQYKEERQVERHQRRVVAGLEKDTILDISNKIKND
jgi:hypothetical protein